MVEFISKWSQEIWSGVFPDFLGDQGCYIAISFFNWNLFLLDESEAKKTQELNETYKAQKAPEIYKIHKPPPRDYINGK